jgi:hypothetical protein
MESEGQLQTNDVDDATRLAASARTLTLTPISDNVVPDDEPDDLVVARHVLAPPIANIPSDEETTAPIAVQTSVEKKNHRRALGISTMAVIILTLATAYFILTK